MSEIEIERLPRDVHGLSDHERLALMEIIPLAADRALHGSQEAATALSWMQGELNRNERENG